ncbi:MAG: DUF3843 family protein [Bacteroidales bacterium]|nr:DUF3843 family protein [Bacteroidales bacterium]
MKYKKAIYVKEWVLSQPYSAPSAVDTYYCELANKIYSIFCLPQHNLPSSCLAGLNKDDYGFFALGLTAYLEDIVSGLGLWKVFTDRHKQLYGTLLPFYNVTDDYFEGEVNYHDVCFLVWYFLSVYLKGEIFNPLDSSILDISKDIFEVFEEEYEYAPENERAREFLQLPPDVTDFYEVRKRIEFILMNSYLYRITKFEYIFEVSKELGNVPKEEKALAKAYSQEVYDRYVIGHVMPLLGFTGKDIFAGILGKTHPLYANVVGLGDKKKGKYVYSSHDDKYIHFKHIASGTIIPVTRKSIDLNKDILEKVVILMSVVKYAGEWWFSGALRSLSEYQDISAEHDPLEDKNLFDDNLEIKQEQTLSLYQRFVKFNKGSELAYLPNPKEADRFIRDFFAWIGKKYNGNVPEETGIDLSAAEEFNDVPTLLFFNKNAGIEMLFGYNMVVDDRKNPFFEKDYPEEELLDLLVSEHAGGDLLRYLLERKLIKEFRFPGEGNALLMKNLGFMLYFYKRQNYTGTPNITIMG